MYVYLLLQWYIKYPVSSCDCNVSLQVFSDINLFLFFSRNGMKNGIENPVWHCGRLVWQHRTLQSRTGITSQRSSSLNPAPMKPMYVFASLVHKWCCLHWIFVSKCISVFYSLYSTSVPCLLRIYGVLNPPRMPVPKCGYETILISVDKHGLFYILVNNN